MAYLGEYQAVAYAADSDKLDGKTSAEFEPADPTILKEVDIGVTVEAFGAGTTAAASAISTHTAAVDPHPQYTTAAEAVAAAPVQLVAGKTGLVTLVKADVGLGNVDNTSDLNKPISTAVSTALGLKADLVDGKVPSSQLPAYVDDVLEFANLAAFPVTGESGIVYVAADNNITYRWSGTTYVVIGSDLALGETSSTALS